MYRPIIRDNAILVAQYATAGLVGILLVPHLVQELGLAAYGRIAVAMGWSGYFCVVIQYAFQLNGPKYMAAAKGEEEERELWIEVASTKVFLLLCVLPMILITGRAYSHNQPHLLIPLVVLPVAATLHSGWFLQAKSQFGVVATFAVLGSSGSLAIGFFLMPTGSEVFATLALVIGQITIGAATFCYVAWRLRIRLRDVRLVSPRRTLMDGAPLFVSQFAASAYSLSGPLVLNLLASQSEAGAFAAVDRVGGAIATAALLTHIAAYPKLAVLFQSEKKQYFRMLGVVVGFHVSASALLGAGLIPIAPYVARHIFGEDAEHFKALTMLVPLWLMVSIFGPAITGYLTLSNRTTAVMRLNALVLITSVAVGIPSAHAFGAVGWYSSILIGQLWIVGAFVYVWLVDRRSLLAVEHTQGRRV